MNAISMFAGGHVRTGLETTRRSTPTALAR
jgi:hypothetical protein